MFKLLFKLLVKLPVVSMIRVVAKSWRRLPGLLWVGGLTYFGLQRFAPDVLDRGKQAARDVAGNARAMINGDRPVGTTSPAETTAGTAPPPTDIATEASAASGVTGMVAEPEPVGGQVGMPLSAS
jgi:hypothetical protein